MTFRLPVTTPTGRVRLFLPGETDEGAVAQLETLAAHPNVATPAIGLPDLHRKSRNPAPTGQVVAVDGGYIPLALDAGINCGMRVATTPLTLADLTDERVDMLFRRLQRLVPTGWRAEPVLTESELLGVMTRGVRWLEERGEWDAQRDRIENDGCLHPDGIDPEEIGAATPASVVRKGGRVFAVLGAGNHFLELQIVQELHDERVGSALGLHVGQAVVMIHTGSGVVGKSVGLYWGPRREFAGARQIRLDARKGMYHMWRSRVPKAHLPRYFVGSDRFGFLPADSASGRRYMAAVAGGANFGYVNRAAIGRLVDEALVDVFGPSAGTCLVYDVSHNLVQREACDGRQLFIHRHGANRALPPSHMGDHPVFRITGQPFPVPGCLGEDSYVCVGSEGSRDALYSANHGVGRLIDKDRARDEFDADSILAGLAARKIRLYKEGGDDLAEQAPGSYKDVPTVIDAMEEYGLAKVVARTRPLAILKG